MEAPPEISCRDVELSEEERNRILERIAKLERYCDHITTCSVAVERTQRHADSGDVFRVRVHVHVPPNHELVGEHSPELVKEKVDLATAINDAFSSIEKRVRRINKIQHEH